MRHRLIQLLTRRMGMAQAAMPAASNEPLTSTAQTLALVQTLDTRTDWPTHRIRCYLGSQQSRR